jgi:hypothetical protein
MRYPLRKYAENKRDLKPIKMTFDSDNDESSASTTNGTVSPMDQLESIPEHVTPQLMHDQIVTRSRLKQIQSPITTANYNCKRVDTPVVTKPTRSALRRFSNKNSLLLQPNKRNDTESSDDDQRSSTKPKNKPKLQVAKFGYYSSDDSEPEGSKQGKNEFNPAKVHCQTPPHKKFRRLRLFDTPLTPKTLIKTAKVPILNSPLVVKQQQVEQMSPEYKLSDEEFQMKKMPRQRKLAKNIDVGQPKLQANINPFTPNHQANFFLGNDTASSSDASLRSLNRLSHSDCTSSATPLVANLPCENRDLISDDVKSKNKCLAISQCSVSRYHIEFHEICRLGSGEFGDVFKCLNRGDGITYAIKRSKKPVVGIALE